MTQLTTRFTPPASCLSTLDWLISSNGFSFYNLGPSPLQTECYPSPWKFVGSNTYSPWACPVGYQTAFYNIVTAGSVTETQVTCCPSSYTFYAPQTDVPCTSTFQSSAVPALKGYSDYNPTAYTTFAPTTILNGTIYAPSIEVRFQSTDASLVNILNQGGTVTARPGAGDSGGAKLGIGIGVGVAGAFALMLLVLGACLLIRKQRQKKQQTEQLKALGWSRDGTLLSPGGTTRSELHPYMRSELADTSRGDLPLLEMQGHNRAVELPVEKSDGRVEKALDSPLKEKFHLNSFPPQVPTKDQYSSSGVLSSHYSLSATTTRSETSLRSTGRQADERGSEIHSQQWDRRPSGGKDQKLPLEELERRYENFGNGN